MLLPGDTDNYNDANDNGRDDTADGNIGNDNVINNNVLENQHGFYQLLPLCEGGGGGGAERHQGGNTHPSFPGLFLLETRNY